MKFAVSLLVVGLAVVSGLTANKKAQKPMECSGIKCGDLECHAPGELITKEGQCCPLCWHSDIAYQRIVHGPTHTEGPDRGAPLPECNNVICPKNGLCVSPTLEEGRCCESCAGMAF